MWATIGFKLRKVTLRNQSLKPLLSVSEADGKKTNKSHGVTVERTRELLGDAVANLSDQQVFEIIACFRSVADVFIDLSVNNYSSKKARK